MLVQRDSRGGLDAAARGQPRGGHVVLLSTPQTGVDSIAVTYALLGPVFAVFRPIAAIVTGLLGGLLVLLAGRGNSAQPDVPPECTDSCCAGDRSLPAWLRALQYGFVTLPRDLAWPLLAGVAIAGAISAIAPANYMHQHLGTGIASILVLMAAGIPLYICATASVPIAAGLIHHMGASPGAVLAFLIVGAATNPAAVTTVWKLLGRRTMLVYLFTVAISALVCGLALDGLFSGIGHWLPQIVAAGGAVPIIRSNISASGRIFVPSYFWPCCWDRGCRGTPCAAMVGGSRAGGKGKPAESATVAAESQPCCCEGEHSGPHQLTKLR